MRPVLLLCLAALACNEPVPPPPPGTVEATGPAVVTVNGQPITQDMVDAVTRRLPPGALDEMKERGQYDQLVENLVVGQLLYGKAVEAGLHQDPGVQKALAMSQREVLAAEMLEKVAREATTDAKLQEMYDQRKVQFQRPQVHARHILVKDETLAKEILGKIQAGEDFGALAKTFSEDEGSRDKGGDLGWFEGRRMVKPFADAAMAAEKGALVGPVETRFGFHVIEVLDKREMTPLEEARPDLEKAIRKEAIEAYIAELKKSATIERADASAAPAPDAPPAPAPDAPPAPAPAPAAGEPAPH